MALKNKQLIEINNSYKEMSNKELSNILIMLKNDFNKAKIYLLELTENLNEFSEVYDNVFDELQSRLKF